MSIVITGATGKLGRLALPALLKKGIPAHEIVAGGRNLELLRQFAEQGVHLKVIDYDRPETLTAAFTGAERVLFISGTDIGQRVRQHQNVIDAARAAGVELIAYTSVAHCDRTTVRLADEDKPTELALKTSGIPSVLLRHAWYTENYTDQIPTALEQGTIVGSAGAGRVSAATRADLAEADIAALLGAQGGEIYEMGGDEAFTLTELAAEVSRQSGKDIAYADLPTGEYRELLNSFGIPAPMDGLLADADRGVRDGEMLVETGDLSRLLGRPTTSLAEAVRTALS
ncbi:NAD(P)-dependent oxidoreductase [Kineosporia sp. NBRC 101677]|uniref:SDR family oxidoreductase n=1 Tax=Kineosporia sp. NBRC 101677 TaxID=3032197 RepID=UPI0024A0D96F|nr:SDR family oxidoreductase [Kineosporia sp. NBRC 101677]GLY18773.1 NAD(P)-dependent oxidoreductase [Kineosporia sp. NBRC 101677]